MPGTKQANNPPSPPLFTVESQPGGADDRNVKKHLRSVVKPNTRISPIVSVAIVETALVTWMSDEPCRRDEEPSLEEGAPGVESRRVALLETQNTLAV